MMVANAQKKVAECERGLATVFKEVKHASAWLADDCVTSDDPLEFDFSAKAIGEFDFRWGEYFGQTVGPDGQRRFIFLGTVSLPCQITIGERTFERMRKTAVYFCLGISTSADAEEFLVPSDE